MVTTTNITERITPLQQQKQVIWAKLTRRATASVLPPGE